MQSRMEFGTQIALKKLECKHPIWKRLRRAVFIAVLYIAATAPVGCGTGTTSVPDSPPSNPPSNPTNVVSITITPTSGTIFLGESQQFQATVSGTTNESVTWEVDGQCGGNSTIGEISSAGIYSAPALMPSTAGVTITAVSAADSITSASASVTIHDDIVVSISPTSASVPQGAQQQFTASISASGNPAPGVAWSVNGIPGGNTAVGTIVPAANGGAVYSAPSSVPSPATVTISAASVADSSKTGTASVTISCPSNGSISPAAASIGLGASQALTASFCLADGATIAWDVDGAIGGSATNGTITITDANTASYAAPADLPLNTAVTIHATASAVTAGASIASDSVTIISNVSIVISPPSATVGAYQRMPFVANVSGTPDIAVSWLVDGVGNGNATIGQICIPGSNPCASPTGPTSVGVDFLAPASVPTANPVVITAISKADSSKTGSASVTITGPAGPVGITVAPGYVFLPPSSSQVDTQQFSATLSGTANTVVTWALQSAVNGQGCIAAACGSISSSGLYGAPTTAPSPNAITVIATSQADTTKSASATIVISSGPSIESIVPSSVMAGAVEGFPLIVHGVNFTAGSGGAASVLLLNGQARATTCASAGQCAIALQPSDVTSAGTITIEIQNPGVPGTISNPVPFVIIPFDVSSGTISLSDSQSVASGTDIVVTDPTTAAASSPINVESVGTFSGGNCAVQGSPLAITRPSSGTETVSICVYGSGLDPTFTYAFTGPAAAPNSSDIGVTASSVTGLFAGVIELDLQVTSATLPGLRSLVATTLNNDRAIATGILEVQ